MGNIASYVAVVFVGAMVTLVANKPARSISLRLGYSAQPDERKVHKNVTPYGGGAAMLVGFCVALLAAFAIPSLRAVITSSHEMMGVLLATGVIFVVGVIDDFREMSAPAKVAGQFLAASVLYLSGCTMYQLKLPFAGFVVLGPSMLPIITAIWVFTLSNAVNLIDGLDGLAGGIVAIASGTLCVYGLRLEDLGLLPTTNVGPLIAALTCGICLGFLRDNFHPAKLFMGDAGALMLGLLMSASTMVIGGRTPPVSGQTFFFFAPLLIPVFILGVPLLDAVWAFTDECDRRTSCSSAWRAFVGIELESSRVENEAKTSRVRVASGVQPHDHRFLEGPGDAVAHPSNQFHEEFRKIGLVADEHHTLVTGTIHGGNHGVGTGGAGGKLSPDVHRLLAVARRQGDDFRSLNGANQRAREDLERVFILGMQTLRNTSHAFSARGRQSAVAIHRAVGVVLGRAVTHQKQLQLATSLASENPAR